MDPDPAVVDESREPARPEPATVANVGPAAAGALAAAVVAGIAWGYLVKVTSYEIGFAAWAIGFIVGAAAVFAAGHRKGLPIQVVAVVAALLGIVIGKYLSFALVLQDEAKKFNASVSVFSGETWNDFMDAKSDVWSIFDLLWVGLAIATAWRAARPDETRTQTA